MHVLIFLIAATAAGAPLDAQQQAVESVIRNIDMCSFPNSLGPRCDAAPQRLRDFAGMTFEWRGGALEVTDNGGWLRRFTPLPAVDGQYRFCFLDSAKGAGGTYLVQRAIELSEVAGRTYSAKIVSDTRCGAYGGKIARP